MFILCIQLLLNSKQLPIPLYFSFQYPCHTRLQCHCERCRFLLPARCVVSMVYYGLSLNSGYLYGGVHLNFFLSVVVEFIAYAMCFPLLDRIGRKALHSSCMIVGGVACCCTIFTVLFLSEGMYSKPVSQAFMPFIYIHFGAIFLNVCIIS